MVYNQFIDLDLEGKELQIKTDSALNSNHLSSVLLFDSAGTMIGAFVLKFGVTLQFSLGYCTDSSPNPVYSNFDSTPTTETEKTWRISEKADQTTLYVYCNDELVLTYVYANSPNQASCNTFGNADISKIKFYELSGSPQTDTASDSYRIVGKKFWFSWFDMRESMQKSILFTYL